MLSVLVCLSATTSRASCTARTGSIDQTPMVGTEQSYHTPTFISIDLQRNHQNDARQLKVISVISSGHCDTI